MTSSSNSTVNRPDYQSWSHCGGSWGRKGSWTGFNIAAMVAGFVFFWPVGLVILYWIIRGRDVRELPHAAREQWSRFFSGRSHQSDDNIVFNEYQQTQYDRIREIKEEIRARQQRFNDYRGDIKRRADEEEFNRFMASSPTTSEG